MYRKIFISIILIIGIIYHSNAQCVQCSVDTVNVLGTNASRIGTNTIATGNSAFSSGYNSIASGNYSTAIGYNATSTGLYSVSIGKYVNTGNSGYAFGWNLNASALNSVVIGSGYSSSAVLENNIAKSLMLGINSSSPSITIRQTSSLDEPAFVGVGITNPQQMLHINGNAMISGAGNGLLFAYSSTSSGGNFGIKYTGSGLNFFLPASGNGTNTNNLLFIKSDGNIGIGTGNPTTKLDVSGTARATNIISTSSIQASTLSVSGLTQSDSLTVTNKIQSNSLKVTENIQARLLQISSNVVFNGLAGSSSKVVTVGTDGKLSSADYSTFYDNLGNHTATQDINLSGNKIVGSSAGTKGIYVSSSGNVRIGDGSMIPTNALEVNGTVRSKEVLVEITGWSDFVFKKDYNLMSLAEVERYVKENGHLPGVPSAADVEENGIGLGEMNAILLQKIEEMTLHLIEMEKRMQEMEKNIKQ